MKSQGQVEGIEALMAKKKFSKKKNESKKGQSSNQDKRNNSGDSFKSEKPCFLCSKKGHWKRECPQKKKKSETKQESTSTDAFVCHAWIPACDKDAWVLDSGASDHMCHRREWFENFTEVSRNVTIGNGARIKAQGKGDINVFSFNGNEWIRKRMVNVLYVPKIHLNLFSSGKAMDHGHLLWSDDKRCELLKNGNVVAVGVRREKLFQMLRVVEPSQEDEAIANVAIKNVSLRTWHERLGHQNIAYVKKFLKSEGIDFVDEDFACEVCVYGKHHRGSFKNRKEKSTKCGEIIHADVCGPMEEDSLGGSRYFLLLKDDYSHFRFVYFMRQKSEVASNVKRFVRLTQKDGHNICFFRSDNGIEFINDEMKTFFDEMGIHHQRTVPYTSEQNGCVEREMRTVVESARTMIYSKQMSKKFWAEAVNTAIHVLNRTGTSNVVEKTPYELWYNRQAKINHLRIFGSEVFVHIPKEKRQKLDPKAVKCIFVGYDNNSKGYRVWNTESNKMEVVHDMIFLLEESTVVLEIDGETTRAKNELKTDDTEIDNAKSDGANKDDSQQSDAETSDNEMYATPTGQKGGGTLCNIDRRNIIRHRLRDRSTLSGRRLSYTASACHMAMLGIMEEPRTYDQAIKSANHEQWEKAMDEEYNSLIKNGTWNLVKPPPNNQKVIDNRWVF